MNVWTHIEQHIQTFSDLTPLTRHHSLNQMCAMLGVSLGLQPLINTYDPMHTSKSNF